MANIDEMQVRRDRTVEEHEKTLLRQFRSNIIEVEDRLKKEQSKEDDVAGVPRAWIERTAQLSKDVDKHKEQVSIFRANLLASILNSFVCKMLSRGWRENAGYEIGPNQRSAQPEAG